MLDRHLSKPVQLTIFRRSALLGARLSPRELQEAFARARVPDVAEIRHLFLAAQPKVLKLADDILS